MHIPDNTQRHTYCITSAVETVFKYYTKNNTQRHVYVKSAVEAIHEHIPDSKQYAQARVYNVDNLSTYTGLRTMYTTTH